MSLLRIYADTRGRDRCKSCQAAIEWAELVSSGRRMPFNAPIAVVKLEQDTVGRLVEVVDASVTLSHFATCPERAEWRRREARQPKLTHHELQRSLYGDTRRRR